MHFVFVPPCETEFVSLVSHFGIYSETEGLLNLVICLQSPKGNFSTVQMILMHTKEYLHEINLYFPISSISSLSTSVLLTDTTLILN